MCLDNASLASPSLVVNDPVLRLGLNLAQGGLKIMFEIFKATNGGYFWRLKANNGETLCHSEVYTAKQSAHNGIAAVKLVAPGAQIYDRT